MAPSRGLPPALWTAAVVVVVGFWPLMLCGAVRHDVFHSDVDTDTLHLARPSAAEQSRGTGP